MPAERHEIVYRDEIASDLGGLGGRLLKRVLDAIENRLSSSPELYGKPLSHELKGLRRIRVGDLRVAYQATDRKVVIWAVLHRKKIYAELAKRLLRLR